MNRMAAALVFIVLTLIVLPAFADSEGPSREDTIEWIVSETLPLGYNDWDGKGISVMQKVYFDENTIRLEIHDQDPPFGSYFRIANWSDLTVKVFFHPDDPGEIFLDCAKSVGACVSGGWTEEGKDHVLGKDEYIRIFINHGMEERARSAFEHLIRLSGGKATVNKNLF